MGTRLLAAAIVGGLSGTAAAQTLPPSIVSAPKDAASHPAPLLLGQRAPASIQGPTANPLSGSSCYEPDSGVSGTAFELAGGGDLAWLTGFEAIGGSDVIAELSAAVGSANTQSNPAAQPAQIAIWDDPTNDFDPADAVLLYSAPIVTSNEDTDILNSYPIPDVAVSGVFFVGVSINHLPLAFPAPFDFNNVLDAQAWIVGSTLGPDTLDLTNLATADVGPLAMRDTGNLGDWLLRAKGINCGPLGNSYCSASANSASASGSQMSLSGSNSLGDMNLTLMASNAPAGQPGLFFYGPSQVDQPLGCGRICIGGSLVRQPVVFENSGAYSFDLDFAVVGLDLAALGTVNFQCWYRDPANSSVCGGTFNLSDAVEITFVP